MSRGPRVWCKKRSISLRPYNFASLICKIRNEVETYSKLLPNLLALASKRPFLQPTMSATAKRIGTSDWVENTDPASGKVYYANLTTKATSWTYPEELKCVISPPQRIGSRG